MLESRSCSLPWKVFLSICRSPAGHDFPHVYAIVVGFFETNCSFNGLTTRFQADMIENTRLGERGRGTKLAIRMYKERGLTLTSIDFKHLKNQKAGVMYIHVL